MKSNIALLATINKGFSTHSRDSLQNRTTTNAPISKQISVTKN